MILAIRLPMKNIAIVIRQYSYSPKQKNLTISAKIILNFTQVEIS